MIIKSLKDLHSISSKHYNVKKKVFIENVDINSSLTQVAYCLLDCQNIEKHRHETMDEYFYVNQGSMIMIVKEKKIFCEKDTLICVPAKHYHEIIVNEPCGLLYFGIKI